MKILPFVATLACASLTAFGQAPAPAPSDTPAPSTPPPVAAPSMRPRMGMLSLTPDEIAKLRAASKAAQQDPDVKIAAAKMRDAMKAAREAMVAKNKALSPLLDKVEASASPGAQRPTFSADERQQLRDARQSIIGTPEAQAWQEATQEYRDALHKAMVAADPSVQAILDKMPQPRIGGPGGPGGPGGHGGLGGAPAPTPTVAPPQ